MNISRSKRLSAVIAALLALALALAGCGANAPTYAQESPAYEVTDMSAAQSRAYAPESPAIDELVALPGQLAVSGVSTNAASRDEVRAVWVSYLELADLLTGKSESQFRSNISGVFDNVADYGLNTVIVQVRPFGDALYKSAYFPWSHIATGTEGKDPGFDPLAVMVAEAKNRGLRIEAWVNPYRVRANGNTKALSSDNKAKIWLDSGKSSVIKYNGVISYNPASADARNLIVNGIAEIVKNYDVDGVHIDDYFYPTTDAAFDKASYNAYKKGGGTLPLADWRRSNVEKLIGRIYSAVKKADRNAVFGISPQSSVDNNYNAQYLDVEKIAGNPGYCDYICPQIYFGYKNAVQPYKATLEKWSRMVENSPVQLYVGLGAYKIGGVDSWAGSGKNEWVSNTDLLARMVGDARMSGSYRGFVLYRYDSIFKPAAGVKASVQKERKNLEGIL